MAHRELEDPHSLRQMREGSQYFADAWQEPDFEHVGRIVGPWQSALDELEGFVPWAEGQRGQKGGFKQKKSSSAIRDQGYAAGLYYLDVTDTIPSRLQKMADVLGLAAYDVRIHRQSPGQMLPVHIDNYKGHTARAGEQGYNINAVQRFLIALSDWDFGHYFAFGRSVWTNWCAGDIVFSWQQDVPHCTANCGFTPRYTMCVTGYQTTESQQLIDGPFRHIDLSPEQ